MTENTASLLQGNWRLAVIPDRDFSSDLILADPDALAAAGRTVIPARVPGNFELDLFAAGLIDDPYFDVNTLSLQKLEDRHLLYTLDFDAALGDGEPVLRFEGLDTVAEVYLNGLPLGSADNMFIAHEFAAAGLRPGQNRLTVHILPVTLQARRFPTPPGANALRYNYDALRIRKAAHMFGWDIMPRIVSGGIYKEVKLLYRPSLRIEDVFGYTLSADAEAAQLCFYYQLDLENAALDGFTVQVSGVCGDSVFSASDRLWHTCGQLRATLPDPRLWMPKNAGQPHLYEVTFTLLRDGQTVDERRFALGVRTVRLERSSVISPDGSGEFCFYVNDKRVFLLGTNWVPADAFHSRDEERLPEMLRLLDDIGCNAVRCWGGNVYESDAFYDFCDRHGIAVWQDFAMGCAVYPRDEDFINRLKPEVVSVVKRLRNHASLLLWAGDNECDCACRDWGGVRRDPNDNLLTRRVIPEILQMEDFTRPYLPSSPYIDETAYATGLPTAEEHLWGPRDYFKGPFYANSVCRFASETGYHGCPSPDSLRRFLSPESLQAGLKDGEWLGNEAWFTHAASPETAPGGPYNFRIKLMNDQVKTLFGAIPQNISDYAKASQISQAEAKKYFIERFRIRKWSRTGIIWWNLIDGWPQISDAVVDYYYCRKLAYGFIKRSQTPVLFAFDEPQDGFLNLYAINDTPTDAAADWTVRDAATGAVLAEGGLNVPADRSLKVGAVAPADGEQRFFLIEWTLGGRRFTNHYVSNIKGIGFTEYLRGLNACGYGEFDGFSTEE